MNRSFRSIALRVVVPFAVSLGAALALRSVITFYSVPSSSMEPTLYPGETIVVRRSSDRMQKTLQRSEVVIFRLPQDDSKFFVKRVVAIAGDYVEIVRGELHVNGELVDETYVSWKGSETVAAQIIPSGMIFVLGDRRSDSLDSRVWGPLPSRLVVGSARRIFWSFDAGRAEARGHRVRFDRIGRTIR